jgi:predicted nucleic acid-binding Zn ribbon protein
VSPAFRRPDEVTARPLGDVLKQVMRRLRRMDRGKFSGLGRAWAELVGEELAKRSRVTAWREGELTVEVDSSVLMQELNGFMKQTLLEGLQGTEKGRDVARIRFRLGTARGNQEKDAQ